MDKHGNKFDFGGTGKIVGGVGRSPGKRWRNGC